MSLYSSTITGTANLLAYIRLGETSGTATTDASGNGNAGTYNGGYTLGAAGALAGDADTAVTFNGSTGYATLPSSFNVGTLGTDYTIEFWGKPTGTATDMQVTGFLASSRIFQIGVTRSGGNSYWRAAYGPLSGINAVGGVGVAGAAVTLGNWYHVVFAVTSNTPKLYVNGALVATGATSAAAYNVAAALNIGRRSDGSEPFAGSVDEFAVYGRGLTGTEALQHYTAGITPASLLLLRRRRAA